MKLTSTNFLILSVYILIIGVLFGIFTKITKIPTYWLAGLMIMGYTFINNPKAFLKKSVIIAFILFFVLLVFKLLNHLEGLPEVVIKPFGIFSMVYSFILVAIILENIISVKNSKQVTELIGKFAFIIIILGLLISLMNETLSPGIARGSIRDISNLSIWSWTINFGTIYGLPFILISILVFYRGKRVYLFLILSLFFITIIRMGFLTALSVLVLSSVLGFLLRMKVKGRTFAIIAIGFLMLFVLFNTDFVIKILPDLPNEVYKQKANDLTELKQSKSATELFANTRQSVYQQSLKAFQSNVVFGSGQFNDTGQHSFWLDRLGFLGIVGTSFYFLILYTLYKRSLLLIAEPDKYAYRYTWYLLLIVLFFNPFEWPDFWIIIFVLIPCMISYLKTTSPFPYKQRSNKNQHIS